MDIQTLDKVKDFVSNLLYSAHENIPNPHINSDRDKALYEVLVWLSAEIDKEDKAIDEYYHKMNEETK